MFTLSLDVFTLVFYDIELDMFTLVFCDMNLDMLMLVLLNVNLPCWSVGRSVRQTIRESEVMSTVVVVLLSKVLLTTSRTQDLTVDW